MLLEFEECGQPTFRATTPLSRGLPKSKGRGKLSIHFAADQDTVDTIYRIILSANQLSVYGAVAAICEEFEDHQDRTGELVILMGQSFVLGEVKAEAPLHNENPMNDQIIWQQYIQQVESLSPEAKWVNSVRKQDLCVLLKLDNISWPETLVILDIFVQWLVANTPFHETTKLLNQKGGSEETWELDLCWKSRQAFSTSSTELKFELSQWTKTILAPGSEFPTEQFVMWTITSNTTRKILQIHKKRKMYQQAQEWLQPGRRQKQNLNQGNLLARQPSH